MTPSAFYGVLAVCSGILTVINIRDRAWKWAGVTSFAFLLFALIAAGYEYLLLRGLS